MTISSKSLSFQPSQIVTPISEDVRLRRQAENMAIQAIDSLRMVAPEIAPVFETGGVRELIVEQYTRILESGDVRWE
jgi:hypothetical protein